MKKLLLIVSFLMMFTRTAYAETVSLSTYYPAPFGSYDRLRLYPRGAAPAVCDANSEGVMFYDLTLHNLNICRETAPGSGVYSWADASPWTQDSTNDYIYPTDTDTRLNLRIGIRTKTPEFMLTLAGHLANPLDGGILATGVFGTSRVLATAGAGTRFIWHPRKAAMRAGSVSGTQWNDANIGNYSFAAGQNGIASGANSTAIGYGTTASTVGAVALGYQTTSQGTHTTALGSGTTASLLYATAMGRQTVASADYSTAMGDQSTASGDYSTAMGGSTTASADYATAMGRETTAGGTASTAMGYQSNAGGNYSTAIGRAATASAQYATALGYQTQATGNYATALGRGAIASRLYSTAIGRGIEARGNYSVAVALSDQTGVALAQNNTMAIMGGDVGIDVINPGVRLEVGGNVLIRGNLTIANPNAGPLKAVWVAAGGGYYATYAP